MKERNVVLEKSKGFSIRIIRLCQFLGRDSVAQVLSRQLLRSATSIGANLTEAQHAISRKEFLSKTYIAFKECAESAYWLDLLHTSGYLNKQQFSSLHADCQELHRLLSSITKTLRQFPDPPTPQPSDPPTSPTSNCLDLTLS